MFALLISPAFVQAEEKLSPAVVEAQKMAEKIDSHIAKTWKEKGAHPADPSDDAEFMRRVYLDLAGRIPRVAEARAFLDDKRADRRVRLVEELLDSKTYVNHFTNFWRQLMVPQSANQQFFGGNMEIWLRQRLVANTRYDQMVRDIITANVSFSVRNPNDPNNRSDPNLIAFYQANEQKPENLAASTSRLFLGVKLECAQCHDHPFASYTKKQFWEYAAFFSGINAQTNMGFVQNVTDDPRKREIKIPTVEKVVEARFLDGTEPQWKDDITTRAALAEWMTSPKNTYFTRAATNRLWAYFFGIGIIDPVDEPSDDNRPSHPELLAELSEQFAAHDFDLKFVIRSIVLSKTYQLSSQVHARTDENGKPLPPDDLRLFSRVSTKGLSPEQLFDSLAMATGYKEANINQRGFGFPNVGSPRGDFISKFGSQDKRTEYQTSILQALTLMNGKFIGDATDDVNLDKTEMLSAVVNSPFFSHTQRIESLYLATLSRKPRADEIDKLLKYVESGGPKRDPRAALADVFWALLNSSEFILNH